jgi:purine nucleoside permease
MGKADLQRVLFLRTGSNYTMPAPLMDVNKSPQAEYQGFIPALEAAFRVGSQVAYELAAHWQVYAGGSAQAMRARDSGRIQLQPPFSVQVRAGHHLSWGGCRLAGP